MAIDEEKVLHYFFFALKTLIGIFLARVILFSIGYQQHVPFLDDVLYGFLYYAEILSYRVMSILGLRWN